MQATWRTLALATLFSSTALVSAVSAQNLRIGLASEPTSMDPQFHNLATNTQVRLSIFESLLDQDALQALQPKLATEWEAIDETTWRFRLREDVAFHNGTPFTARDVIYSVCRIPMVENSPSSFSIYTKSVAGIEAEDDHTVIIRTDGPNPLLPVESSTWAIMSADASGATKDLAFKKGGCEGMGEVPQQAAFNSPALVVGTGPYKLKEFTRGSQIVLTRAEDYWGDKSEWETITLRPISSAGPRVAALLAGDVDLIEAPPVQDLPRIKNAGFNVVDALSNRVIYIALFQDGPHKGIAGADGKNPLEDPRVREAMSLAINREAIVDRIMSGYATPAGELLPPPMFGTSGRPADGYDPEKAKQLMAEAGYPDGFELTLGTPNDRYINDEQVAQAVAQMLTRIGIRTKVDATTASQFFSRRNALDYPAFLAGWGAASGEMSSPLKSLVATYNPDAGLGVTNAGRYSSPEMDALLEKAMVTIDDDERSELLQQAETIVLNEHGILPLHYERSAWAMSPKVNYEPRVDQYTLAHTVTQATD
ncbi:ABC transporter substrate-binding protein [Haematobacter missouriensis]|uniref:Peptide ABC transporter substrate-binding protein n=1 Tax=Haematobacter missouriensis TaxID=366616 RepID=A0A212AN82_9RHOB|nr:ABC transporter substrate-binding protein [Haematobacter missouriensis]OWJ82935.1 peptide ABC transporter substrate-binding protein [Haematobacter missouriensis]